LSKRDILKYGETPIKFNLHVCFDKSLKSILNDVYDNATPIVESDVSKLRFNSDKSLFILSIHDPSKVGTQKSECFILKKADNSRTYWAILNNYSHIHLKAIRWGIINLAFSQQDFFYCHGSAIALSNETLLILGKKGSGKTTLGLSLLENGYSLIADDSIFLDSYSIPLRIWPSGHISCRTDQNTMNMFSSLKSLFQSSKNIFLPAFLTNPLKKLEFNPTEIWGIENQIENFPIGKILFIERASKNEKTSVIRLDPVKVTSFSNNEYIWRTEFEPSIILSNPDLYNMKNGKIKTDSIQKVRSNSQSFWKKVFKSCQLYQVKWNESIQNVTKQIIPIIIDEHGCQRIE
jgi:energy-coupling factor transporter ATP-binding protein EcfA2